MGKGSPSKIEQVSTKQIDPALAPWMNIIAGTTWNTSDPKNPYAEIGGPGWLSGMQNYITGPGASNIWGSYYDQSGSPKSRVAPFNQTQKDVMTAIRSGAPEMIKNTDLLGGNYLARSLSDDASQRSGFMNELMDTATGKYLNADTNPYLQSYIQMAQRPTLESYKHKIGSDLGTAATAGRVGSGYQAGMLSESERNKDTAMGDIATSLANQAYQGERGRQTAAAQTGEGLRQSAIGLLPNLNQDVLNILKVWGGVGDTEQQQEQAMIADAAAAPWRPIQDIFNYWLNPMSGLVYGSPQSISTSSSPMYGPGPVANAFGAASSLGSLASIAKSLNLV